MATAVPAGAIQLGWDKSSGTSDGQSRRRGEGGRSQKGKSGSRRCGCRCRIGGAREGASSSGCEAPGLYGLEERQFWAVNAYGAARDYVQRAEAGSRAAAHSVQVAIAVWNTSKLDVLKAIAHEAKARATVGVYKDALSELGLAMYTGAGEHRHRLPGEQGDRAGSGRVGRRSRRRPPPPVSSAPSSTLRKASSMSARPGPPSLLTWERPCKREQPKGRRTLRSRCPARTFRWPSYGPRSPAPPRPSPYKRLRS